MSSDSEEVQTSDDVEERLQIFNLPTEILLKIFSFLDAKFLVSSVSLVCRHFHAILGDPNMWKYRVKKRMKYTYPAIGDEDAVDWQRACVSLESERFYWTHRHETMLQLEPADYVHIAAVDSVALIHDGQLCVSGSRDRSLALWDLTSTGSVNGYLRQDAHSGWIWALLPDSKEPGTLYSCSWDYTVKCWDVQRVLEQRSATVLKAAVLSLTQITQSSVLACGQYTGHVALVDTRCSGDSPASLLRPHHRAALGLASWGENVLVSASEEGRLVTTDLRNTECPLDQLTLSDCFPESNQMKSYPTCLSVRGNSLYAGDSKGYVWLFDASGGMLKLVQVQIWRNNQLDPLRRGWKTTIPIATTQSPAPQELLNTISCTCMKGYQATCFCRKAFMCSAICSNCKGLSCLNCPTEEDIFLDSKQVDEEINIARKKLIYIPCQKKTKNGKTFPPRDHLP